MKSKNQNNVIKGADDRLSELLPGFAVKSYEIRESSGGSTSLYIRMKLIQPAVQLSVR